jgi:hypothetical protein
MDILIGILILLFGVAVATMGLRLWFWMLPVLGFLIGFSLATVLVHQLAGDGVLQTLLSWVVGIVAGVAFALASWLWWYLGVILAAGSVGAGLATALAASFGAERGWVLLLVALAGAALFAVGALALRLPVYLVIVNTAVAGALAAVTGLLLIANRIDLEFLGRGYAVAVIEHSPGWWLLWIALAAAGIAVQLRNTLVVGLPDERFVPASRAVRR